VMREEVTPVFCWRVVYIDGLIFPVYSRVRVTIVR
jgi:hypothetical protein